MPSRDTPGNHEVYGSFLFPIQTLKVGDPEGRDCYLALASPRPTVCPQQTEKEKLLSSPKNHL